MRWIDQWRLKKQKKKIWVKTKELISEVVKEKKSEKFFMDFYERGLQRRLYKRMKLFACVAGNRMYQRRVQQKINVQVQAMVGAKKEQLEYLESMIRELEEKYRIELRKKSILKNQCDQAYLRGVSAISNEALKMSSSTLDDIYRGMKLPAYDGRNTYQQMRVLNGAPTMTAQIHEEHSVIDRIKNIDGGSSVKKVN